MMRAFLFLIERIGALVGRGHSTLVDPFKHAAFRIAVDKLFQITRPKGEMVPPLAQLDPSIPVDATARRWLESPESRADVVIAGIMVLLENAATTSDAEARELGLVSVLAGFDNAARDLKIKTEE
jgi:hypothetical protein